MYYSPYNWIGEYEKTFASNPEKRTQKQAQKEMNENGLFDIFSNAQA